VRTTFRPPQLPDGLHRHGWTIEVRSNKSGGGARPIDSAAIPLRQFLATVVYRTRPVLRITMVWHPETAQEAGRMTSNGKTPRVEWLFI
jgi:hypothetical protein